MILLKLVLYSIIMYIDGMDIISMILYQIIWKIFNIMELQATGTRLEVRDYFVNYFMNVWSIPFETKFIY